MNRAKSVSDDLDEPSAIFDDTETADRRNCRVSPNLSSAGKARVTVYMRSAYSTALCQTSNLSNLNILIAYSGERRVENSVIAFWLLAISSGLLFFGSRLSSLDY